MLISPARRLAYKLLLKIEMRRLFSDDAVNSEAMNKLELRDRRLTTEIVYGTLRRQGMLDYILQAASSRPWQEVEPGAKILLRMSLYQMCSLDRIPDHAIVNDAVELAKREIGKGIDRYVNGILRRLTRNRPWMETDFLQGAPAWDRASLPAWLWARWAERYGEAAAEEYAASLNIAPAAAFRLKNGMTQSPPDGSALSDIVPGAAVSQPGFDHAGRGFAFQDEASQLIPHLLGSPAGWCIWDACASPGSKTAILRRLAGEQGRVVSSDLSPERVGRMSQLLREESGSPLLALAADASKAAPFNCRFDAVLADVPCSGLGTIRRNPEIKWRIKAEDLKPLQVNQMRILDSVAGAVRPGGRLLYSTCSTEPEENEAVVNWFLPRHPEFRLLLPDSPPGIEQWVGADGMVRTFPGVRLWDGFFAALMARGGQ